MRLELSRFREPPYSAVDIAMLASDTVARPARVAKDRRYFIKPKD
jgi:hypothetical protein